VDDLRAASTAADTGPVIAVGAIRSRPHQARALLDPVYGLFTKGFDPCEVKEAKARLASLASWARFQPAPSGRAKTRSPPLRRPFLFGNVRADLRRTRDLYAGRALPLLPGRVNRWPPSTGVPS